MLRKRPQKPLLRVIVADIFQHPLFRGVSKSQAKETITSVRTTSRKNFGPRNTRDGQKISGKVVLWSD